MAASSKKSGVGSRLKLKKEIFEDVLDLIDSFSSLESSYISDFVELFKVKAFKNIFGNLCGENVHNLITNGVIEVAKRIMLNAKEFYQKLAALYIIYAFYFEPTGKNSCKITLNLEELQLFKQFVETLFSFKCLDGINIAWKLMDAEAFQFIYINPVNTLEPVHRNEKNKLENNPTYYKLTCDMDDMQTEVSNLLSGFEYLEDGYNEMKEVINSLRNDNLYQPLLQSKVSRSITEKFDFLNDFINNGKVDTLIDCYWSDGDLLDDDMNETPENIEKA